MISSCNIIGASALGKLHGLQWELDKLSSFKEEVELYEIYMELDGKATKLYVTLEEERKASCEAKSYLETLSSGVVTAENELKEG